MEGVFEATKERTYRKTCLFCRTQTNLSHKTFTVLIFSMFFCNYRTKKKQSFHHFAAFFFAAFVQHAGNVSSFFRNWQTKRANWKSLCRQGWGRPITISVFLHMEWGGSRRRDQFSCKCPLKKDVPLFQGIHTATLCLREGRSRKCNYGGQISPNLNQTI